MNEAAMRQREYEKLTPLVNQSSAYQVDGATGMHSIMPNASQSSASMAESPLTGEEYLNLLLRQDLTDVPLASLPFDAHSYPVFAPAALPGDTSRPRRVMGSSCDACKTRKVKCDRNALLKSARAESGSSGPQCSNCKDYKLQCTISTGKARPGKRLQELRERQDASRSHLSESTATPLSWSPVTSGSSSPTTSLWRPTGLLQVHGLTKSLLDACLLAYFKWARVSSGWIRAQEFTPKYHAFFDALNRGQLGITSVEPVSEVLILGVAAAGAGLLEDEVTFDMGTDKFQLQDRLLARFAQLLREQNWRRLTDMECLDVVNACYICSWLAAEDGEPDDSEDDPFERRFLSDELLASFVFKSKLNRKPQLEPRAPADGARWSSGRGGRLLTDHEALQRARTFSALYLYDAFRAIAVRRAPLFTADSHDVVIERTPLAQGHDASFIAQDSASLTSSSNTTRQGHFDDVAVGRLRRLGEIVRQHGQTFVSVPSQSRGVPVQDAERALHALMTWSREASADLAFEQFVPRDWQRGRVARPAGHQLQNLLRCVWIDLMFQGQILAAGHAAHEFGIVGPNAEAVSAQFATVLIGGLFRCAEVCKVGGALGVLRCSPVICRNMPMMYARWACSMVKEDLSGQLTEEQRQTRPCKERLLQAAEDIIGGVATVDSAKHTAALLDEVSKSVTSLKAIMQQPRAYESTQNITPSISMASEQLGAPFEELLERLAADTYGAGPEELLGQSLGLNQGQGSTSETQWSFDPHALL